MAERHRGWYNPPASHEGRVKGWITIVQEDRFRLVDAAGRGYLFVARKRSASLDQLDEWRDEGVCVAVSYRGIPDVGALARRVSPA